MRKKRKKRKNQATVASATSSNRPSDLMGERLKFEQRLRHAAMLVDSWPSLVKSSIFTADDFKPVYPETL